VALRSVGLNFRFDEGPIIPRIAVVSSDFQTVYPWLAAPRAGVAAVGSHTRLRVQIFPTGSGPQLFDFNLTGSHEAVQALGCR